MHKKCRPPSWPERKLLPRKGHVTHLKSAGAGCDSSVFSSSPPQAPGPSLAPMLCQESEYLDEHGKCAPCRNCMPGQELSKVNRLLWKDWESSGFYSARGVLCQPSFARIVLGPGMLGRAGTWWEGTVKFPSLWTEGQDDESNRWEGISGYCSGCPLSFLSMET